VDIIVTNDSWSAGGHESYKGDSYRDADEYRSIGTGLVASLAHPGGNATGLTSIAPILAVNVIR